MTCKPDESASSPPLCPKCQASVRIDHKSHSAGYYWHRVHCPHCHIGAGGYSREEALEKWAKVCAGWKR